MTDVSAGSCQRDRREVLGDVLRDRVNTCISEPFRSAVSNVSGCCLLGLYRAGLGEQDVEVFLQDLTISPQDATQPHWEFQ